MNAKEKLADYQRQFGVYAEANSEVMGAFGATVTAARSGSRTKCRSTDLWRTWYGIQRISTGSL